MGSTLRMPRLPRGPRAGFVNELHSHYRAARRPTLRAISEAVRDDDTLAGSASRETIRRMLLGEVVPAQWETVNAVFLTLCKLAGRDPNAYTHDDSEARTYAEELEWYWNEALDESEPAPSVYDDPWASAPPAQLGEPPF